MLFIPVNAPALAFFAKVRHMRFEMISNWVSLVIQWNLAIPDNRNDEIVRKCPTSRPTLNHSTTSLGYAPGLNCRVGMQANGGKWPTACLETISGKFYVLQCQLTEICVGFSDIGGVN
jgi:hypothetical protein